MAKSTDTPSFGPSSEWYKYWPFGVDTLVQVEPLTMVPNIQIKHTFCVA